MLISASMNIIKRDIDNYPNGVDPHPTLTLDEAFEGAHRHYNESIIHDYELDVKLANRILSEAGMIKDEVNRHVKQNLLTKIGQYFVKLLGWIKSIFTKMNDSIYKIILTNSELYTKYKDRDYMKLDKYPGAKIRGYNFKKYEDVLNSTTESRKIMENVSMSVSESDRELEAIVSKALNNTKNITEADEDKVRDVAEDSDPADRKLGVAKFIIQRKYHNEINGEDIHASVLAMLCDGTEPVEMEYGDPCFDRKWIEARMDNSLAKSLHAKYSKGPLEKLIAEVEKLEAVYKKAVTSIDSNRREDIRNANSKIEESVYTYEFLTEASKKNRNKNRDNRAGEQSTSNQAADKDSGSNDSGDKGDKPETPEKPTANVDPEEKKRDDNQKTKDANTENITNAYSSAEYILKTSLSWVREYLDTIVSSKRAIKDAMTMECQQARLMWIQMINVGSKGKDKE